MVSTDLGQCASPKLSLRELIIMSPYRYTKPEKPIKHEAWWCVSLKRLWGHALHTKGFELFGGL